MYLRFDGRRVIVTGGGHGFGRAIATGFARLGAQVAACDLDADELEETASLVPGMIDTVVCDVTDPEAVARFVKGVRSLRGGIDILVNNAGGVCGQVGRPIEEITPADWQAIVAVNMTGAFYLAQAVAPAMKAAGSGRIVNIASTAGLGVSKTGIQAYASAKAGQIGLTRQLAHELGPHGITVNCVAPGFIRSNPASERQWQAYGEEGQRRMIEGIALRRLGSAQDIADAVLFLASDRAGWISGQVLAVDGGK